MGLCEAPVMVYSGGSTIHNCYCKHLFLDIELFAHCRYCYWNLLKCSPVLVLSSKSGSDHSTSLLISILVFTSACVFGSYSVHYVACIDCCSTVLIRAGVLCKGKSAGKEKHGH